MDDVLSRLVSALSPVMNSVQAEGFLHVAAFTRSKAPERLDVGDWPAIESAVREVLEGTDSSHMADEVCARLRDVLLRASNGSGC